MTRVVARILGSMLCVPMIIIACVAFVFIIDELNLLRDEIAATVAVSAATIALAGAWLLLWRPLIRWTPRRRTGTMVLFAVAIAAEFTVIVLAHAMLDRRWSREPVVVFVNLGIGLLTLGLLLRLWTETARERIARIRSASAPSRICPACRYDMSGLTNLTCPECGAAYTLGQLADEHQRAAAPVDLE